MKKFKYDIIFIIMVFALSFSCSNESMEGIGDPVFYIQLPETAPNSAFPNKEINFPVEVFAQEGLDKIEVRVDFQPLDGTLIDSFDDPRSATYDFSYTPTGTDLGKTLEFTLVAYDKKGFTYDVSYTVSIVLEPVVIDLVLPEDLPDTLNIGDMLDFDIQINSEDEIDRVETIHNNSVLSGLTVDSFEGPHNVTYHFSYEIQPEDGGQDVTFYFRATDVEQKVKEASYTFYVIGERIPLPVNSYADVTLGMQSNGDTGPFIDLVTNTVHTVPNAKINSASVDFGTFRSGSSGINLFAPSYSNAAQFIYNSANWGDDNLGSWAVKNATEIRRISSELMTTEDFDAITDDELILEVFDLSGPSVDDITQVAVGEIISFKTADEKYGLVLVKSLVSASNGSVTFDYKIQQ